LELNQLNNIMKSIKFLTTSIVMTMSIALSFSANAQTDRVAVTNNTLCEMTVAIAGSTQSSPCSNDLGEGTAVVPAGSTVVVLFYDNGSPVTTYFMAGAAAENDIYHLPTGTGAFHDQCTSTYVTGVGPNCTSFNITITGRASMEIN